MGDTKRMKFKSLDGAEHEVIAEPGEAFGCDIDGTRYMLRIRDMEKGLFELIPAGPVHVGHLQIDDVIIDKARPA